MTDLKKLRELAEKATYHASEWESEEAASTAWKANKTNNAAWCRAANPETVLALIDKVEATESLNSSLYSEIRRLRSQLAEYENDDEMEVNHE